MTPVTFNSVTLTYGQTTLEKCLLHILHNTKHIHSVNTTFIVETATTAAVARAEVARTLRPEVERLHALQAVVGDVGRHQ